MIDIVRDLVCGGLCVRGHIHVGRRVVHTSVSFISSASSMLSTVKQPWLMKKNRPGSGVITSFPVNKDNIYI